MRTALFLLLMLAIAAVPGSVFPQRSADPNGVTQYFDNYPEAAPILDAMQLFDVYTSVWFSAIYILLVYLADWLRCSTNRCALRGAKELATCCSKEFRAHAGSRFGETR